MTDDTAHHPPPILIVPLSSDESDSSSGSFGTPVNKKNNNNNDHSTPVNKKNSANGITRVSSTIFASESAASLRREMTSTRLTKLIEIDIAQAPLPIDYAERFTDALQGRTRTGGSNGNRSDNRDNDNKSIVNKKNDGGDDNTLHLAPMTLKFSDGFIEAEYSKHHLANNLKRSRLVMLVASVVYFLWGIMDLVVSAENNEDNWKEVVALRFTLCAIAVGIAVYGFNKKTPVTGKLSHVDDDNSSGNDNNNNNNNNNNSSRIDDLDPAKIDEDDDFASVDGDNNGNSNKSGRNLHDADAAAANVFSWMLAVAVFAALSITVIIGYLQVPSFPRMETTGFVIVLASAVVVLHLRFTPGFVVMNLFTVAWCTAALIVGFSHDIPQIDEDLKFLPTPDEGSSTSQICSADDLGTQLVQRVLVVILAHVVFTVALYEGEAISKRQFVRDMMLRCEFAFTKAENANLKDLLDTFRDETGSGAMSVDLSAPAEKMVATLTRIKDSRRVSRNDEVQLEWMVQLLRSNAEIYAPDLAAQADVGRIDRETSSWLVTSVAGGGGQDITKTPRGDKKRPQLIPTIPALEKLEARQRRLSEAIIPGGFGLAAIEADNEIREAMKSWKFDIRMLELARPDTGLQFVTTEALKELKVLDSFPADKARIPEFLDAAQRGYSPDVPYHNSFHGADTVQAVFYLLTECGLAGNFEPFELFGMIIGAAIHDLEHPGLNNNFEIATRSDRALLYNDMSPLENHHVSRAFFLMREDRFNILKGVPRADYARVRQILIDVVLATDLKSHFAIVAQLKAMISAGFDASKAEDRTMMAKAIVKCADVSNPTRPTAIMDLWTDRFVEETWAQGDREKELGLPVSAFMDRFNTSVPKLEIGFTDFLVRPLYEQVNQFAQRQKNLNAICKHLEDNYKTWKDRFDKEEALKSDDKK